MGLFNAFNPFKKNVEVDQAKSKATKTRMRELFDTNVNEGTTYNVVYAFSEDVHGANFGFGRSLTYRYQNFILGFRSSDAKIVLLAVSPDLSQVGEPVTYKSEDMKKTRYIAMVGQYYLQYGSAIKKEFLNLKVPKTLDDIISLDMYDEDEFLYVDQSQDEPAWVDFWQTFSK